ncbi:YciC family protein [Zophobihabitans entericus]|uniref:Uncharacterized protein n=1 Tax=Zophobihabitans entericus TaxID=1635327 RepID=A0A6G9IDH4_9GAMM|nr:YciC family protein [Zophobihabitans entericus]QIQ22285.1 hypothetical protein IPMB12_11675 [Zophobihabitans entericus]
MPLSFSAIFSDTKNFIFNRLLQIFIILLILAIITQMITFMVIPNQDILKPIEQFLQQTAAAQGDFSLQSVQSALARLSPSQQQEIVSALGSYAFRLLIVYVISNLLGTSIILAMIANLSHSDTLNIPQLIGRALTHIPQLLTFMIVSIPFFVGLSVVGMLIAPLMIFILLIGMFIYTIVYNVFLSCLIEPKEQTTLFNKIGESFQRSKAYAKLILPMVGIWLVALIVVSSLVSNLTTDNFILNVVVNIVGLFLNFFLISYCYRLYTLTPIPVKPNDTRY